MEHTNCEKPHTSFSELSVFNTCRYRWQKEKVEKVEVKPTEAMTKGTIGHKWFEFYYTENDPTAATLKWIKENKDLMDEEKEYMIELFDDMKSIFENYLMYHPEPEGLVSTEKELLVSLPIKFTIHERKNKKSKRPPRASYFIRMFIDAIIQDKDGNYWAVEHKFPKQMYDQDYLLRHPQARMYVWGLNRVKHELGFKVKGLIINQVKSTPLSEPKILKNGKISVSQINITGKMFEKYLDENVKKEEKKKYLDKIEELDSPNNLAKFFRKDYVWLTENQEKAIENNIIENARELRNLNKRIYRNFGQHCSNCNFREQCENDLNNGVI